MPRPKIAADTVPDDDTSADLAELLDEPADTIATARVEWFWPDRLEWSTVAVVQGAKEAGKSTWLRRFAAHVTGKACLPGAASHRKPIGNVLWYAGEEHKSTRVRPGLAAAGADLSRCFIQSALDDLKGQRLQLPHDCERLKRRIQHRSAVLVVIDPVFSFVGPGADIEGPTQPARDFMLALGQVAAATGSLIILSRNLTKRTADGALASGRGSGEIGNAARSVLHVQQLPGEEAYALAVAACNNGKKVSALRYTLADKGGQGVIDVSGEVAISADDLAAGDEGDTDRYLLEHAKELIRRVVPTEGIASSIIKGRAEVNMIKPRTLQQAAKALHVRYRREGSRDQTVVFWLPPRGGWGK